MPSVTKNPLFRILRCDSVAPLGKPVVPEVYWMLIGSVLTSVACRSRSSPAGTAAARSAAQSGVPRKITSVRAGASARTSATIAT